MTKFMKTIKQYARLTFPVSQNDPLLQLSDDWDVDEDGSQAPKPTIETIGCARKLEQSLKRDKHYNIDVCPDVLGGIDIYVTCEADTDERFVWVFFSNTGDSSIIFTGPNGIKSSKYSATTIYDVDLWFDVVPF